MKVLVTGGAGFIGSNFVRYWVRQHPDDVVVAYDALTYAGNRPNLVDIEDRIRFVHGDVCDGDLALATLRDHDIDTIVHFAAESHNSLAVLDPGRFFRTNVLGTQTMLEAARHAEVGRFHHISTCEVYGDLALDSDDAFTEDHPYRPRTPYNASKAGADHAVRAYVETYELAATITNCSNNYGPYQFPEKVIPLFAAHALDDRPLPLYESTRNQREWLHVVDHCRAIEAVLERGRIGETYHVGSGVEASIEEIADAVLETLGKPDSLKKIVPDRPGHDRRYLLDCTKITTELGWAPTVGFKEGLADTVRWYADNRDWWEPLMDRAPVVESSWGDDSSGTSDPRGGGDRGHARQLDDDRRPDVRVLVTGAGGQLGTDVVEALAGRVPTGGRAGDPATGRLGRRSPCEVTGADHALLDVADRGAVQTIFEGVRPHVVVHAGAWTAVDACEGDPDRAYAVNALGTRHVAEAARRVGAHVVYVSTDYVFDGTSTRPYLEWDDPNPMSVYGRSKLGGERELDAGSTVVRTSWVCGAHGANMVRTVLRLADQPGPLRFVDDQWGSPTFTADLAGLLAVLATERLPGTFHATNSGVTSWYGFAREVLEVAGHDPTRVEPIATTDLDPPRPAPRPANSVLDNAALRLLGMAPLPSWRDGLERLVAATRPATAAAQPATASASGRDGS